jgi:hypothetical protein
MTGKRIKREQEQEKLQKTPPIKRRKNWERILQLEVPARSPSSLKGKEPFAFYISIRPGGKLEDSPSNGNRGSNSNI